MPLNNRGSMKKNRSMGSSLSMSSSKPSPWLMSWLYPAILPAYRAFRPLNGLSQEKQLRDGYAIERGLYALAWQGAYSVAHARDILSLMTGPGKGEKHGHMEIRIPLFSCQSSDKRLSILFRNERGQANFGGGRILRERMCLSTGLPAVSLQVYWKCS